MISYKKVFFETYSQLIAYILLIFLFGILSFGRAFSIIYIPTPLTNLFLTEAILIFSLPLIIVNSKYFFELPKPFLFLVCLFFIYGFLYLFIGIINKNFLALRDIVLCGYILFLPIVLIVFFDKNNLTKFLFILMASNIINICVGRNIIFGNYLPLSLNNFISHIKTFNLGLYYGITFSFLFPFVCFFKKRLFDFFTAFLLSLNSYMMLVLGVRAVWVALLFVLIFLFIILKKKFLKIIFKLILLGIPIFTILYFIDFRYTKSVNKDVTVSKVQGTVIFIEKVAKSLNSLKNPGSPLSADTQNRPVLAEVPLSADTQNRPVLGYKEYAATPQLQEQFVRSSFENVSWRLKLWGKAVEFGLKSFIWGNGFGDYSNNEVGAYPLQGLSAGSGATPIHNHILTIFVKMGLSGIVLFLGINIYILVYGIKHIARCKSEFARDFLIGSLGGFIFWHIEALFFDVIESPPTSVFLWILIGMIFAVIKIDKERGSGLTE